VAALDDDDQIALREAPLTVAAIVEEVPEVGELTINPLIVRGGTAIVTQAHATVHPVDQDPLPPVRRV
jgi:hypothetical protein